MGERQKWVRGQQDFRILFSDIDGTLINSQHHIPGRTREKILELDRKGIPFILVSARGPAGVEVIRRELGNRKPFICYSGGLVLDALTVRAVLYGFLTIIMLPLAGLGFRRHQVS